MEQKAMRVAEQDGQTVREESPYVARARRALELSVEQHGCRTELHEDLFTDDYSVEPLARGGSQVYSSLERGEFRRGRVEILEAVESGARVIAHVRVQVERHHEVEGTPSTQECSADGIVTFEFQGDLIKKSWSMLRWR